MGAIASQITSLTIIYSIINSGAGQRKQQSSASPVSSEFPAHMASNTENAYIWWRQIILNHQSCNKNASTIYFCACGMMVNEVYRHFESNMKICVHQYIGFKQYGRYFAKWWPLWHWRWHPKLTALSLTSYTIFAGDTLILKAKYTSYSKSAFSWGTSISCSLNPWMVSSLWPICCNICGMN